MLFRSVRYSIANATHQSNLVQGATFSVLISGAGDIVKDGVGSLVLSNPGNTFVGNLISNNGGYIAATSDAALGAASNQILINGAGFRAMDTWTSNRTISLLGYNNWIQVTSGKTLTLNTPFGGNPLANLLKEDVGTLVLAAPNPNWNGNLTVSQGVVVAADPAALGAGTNTIVIASTINAAFQLAGGITIPQNITVSSTANTLNGGIQATGALSNASGTNTLTGVLTIQNDATVGSVAGNLILAGGVNLPASKRLQFAGPGDITLTGQGFFNNSGGAWAYYQIEHFGTGTLDLQSTNRLFMLNNQLGVDCLAGLLALGQIAHNAVLAAYGLTHSRHPFAHGAMHDLGQGRVLADSYHCSRLNTNTGRLTEAMFADVVGKLKKQLEASSKG